jgi:excisionase family DNA binding protein
VLDTVRGTLRLIEASDVVMRGDHAEITFGHLRTGDQTRRFRPGGDAGERVIGDIHTRALLDPLIDITSTTRTRIAAHLVHGVSDVDVESAQKDQIVVYAMGTSYPKDRFGTAKQMTPLHRSVQLGFRRCADAPASFVRVCSRMLRSVFVERAAEILGVSRRTVYYRIREGRLRTIRTRCGSQRVLLDSIDELLRAAAKPAPARVVDASGTDRLERSSAP